MGAPGANCGMFCLACIAPPCVAWNLRSRAIQHDWTKYQCCQGYVCPQCFATPGCNQRVQQCPKCYFCIELTLCCSLAMSGTRTYVQVERQIMTDPCDNRIIRLNNIIQLLACVCQIAAIFMKELRQLADLLRLIADIVWCTTQGCMQAQTDLELSIHPTLADYGPITQQPGFQQVASDKKPLLASQPPPYNG